MLAGAITTARGLYIEAQKITGVTTGYSIYSGGASDVAYFAGTIGIGTSTPTYQLSVEGTSSLGNEARAGYFTATTTATNTFPNLSSTNATTTGAVNLGSFTSALLQTDGDGDVAEYAGTSCTNQFVRSLSALGAATCATVTNTDLANSTISGIALGSNLADLTATNSTLTFSGTYNGGTARSIGLNLGNANTWTALQTFAGNGTTTFAGGIQGGTLVSAPFFHATSTTATSTFAGGIQAAKGYFTSFFQLGSDVVSDITGFGMAVASGALGLDTTGAADEECLTYESTGPGIEWQPCAGSDISARVYQTAVTSVTTSWVSLAFGAENFDTDTMHDNSTNNTRITFNTAGKYHVGGCWYGLTNNVVGVRVRLNGTTVLATQKQGNSGNPEGTCVDTIYQFSSSDYIELQGYSGSTQDSSGDANTSFWAIKY